MSQRQEKLDELLLVAREINYNPGNTLRAAESCSALGDLAYENLGRIITVFNDFAIRCKIHQDDKGKISHELPVCVPDSGIFRGFALLEDLVQTTHDTFTGDVGIVLGDAFNDENYTYIPVVRAGAAIDTIDYLHNVSDDEIYDDIDSLIYDPEKRIDLLVLAGVIREIHTTDKLALRALSGYLEHSMLPADVASTVTAPGYRAKLDFNDSNCIPEYAFETDPIAYPINEEYRARILFPNTKPTLCFVNELPDMARIQVIELIGNSLYSGRGGFEGYSLPARSFSAS